MVNPADLTSAIITKLQSIAALVTLLGGDENVIIPYRRNFPDQMSLGEAIYRAPKRSITVVWEGTVTANYLKMEKWKDNFSLYVKAGDTLNGDGSAGFYAIWNAIMNGIPSPGDGQPFQRTEIHSGCFQIDSPSITPQEGRIAESPTVYEYCKISFGLVHKGE